MSPLGHEEVCRMLLAVGLLLAAARVLGELAQRLRQPAVLGEIIAGLLMGPTVLGRFAPAWHAALFPAEGPNAIVLDGLVTLSIVLFLLVAGIEADLSTIWRQRKTALVVGLAGIVVPFALGFVVAYAFPKLMGFQNGQGDSSRLVFALFLATALSITALPVITKTLMDLNLYRSDLGMVIVAAAVFNDLVGWIIFAVLLASIGVQSGLNLGAGATVALTLGFAFFVLTIGRWAVHRALPWLHAYTHWPGGVLSFTLGLAFFAAAFTQWIGVHAIFGSFLVGVAIGDSPHFREQTRTTIEQFVSFIFAPLFFASIGLRVDFAAHFDPLLVMVILAIACIGKIVGCGAGARLAGMEPREALATGFGMNGRGAMEIILGLLALQSGLIDDRLFVALVVMALVTSMMSGPGMIAALRRRTTRRLVDYVNPKMFVPKLDAEDTWQAIDELARVIARVSNLDADALRDAVLAREDLQSTGIGHGVALPHARMAGIDAPLLAVGLSAQGIDFNAPDGEPAQVIFLLATPEHDNLAQIELAGSIARTFMQPQVSQHALAARTPTEFIAVLKSVPG